MKRILLPALVVVAAFASREAPPRTEGPFPATSSGDVFVIAQTVTTDGSMHDYFKPGETVVFRAYAVDGKNQKILTEAKYFYATIPGQPNVKYKYDPKSKTALGQYAWIGTWTVPSTYQLGLGQLQGARPVEDEAARLVRADAGRRRRQLTITNTPPATGTTPPGGDRRRRAARTTRSSTPTASTARVPQALRRGRSAARRPTCSSAASSSCSARGASTWKTKTVLSLENVYRGALHGPGAAERDAELGLARDGEGVLLDERLEHPVDVPAGRHHG